MATAFSDLDAARESSHLNSYMNGLGAIANPEKFREDNLNREAFNNMVTLGTATFGAPLAAHGLEGLKSDIGIRYKAAQSGKARRAVGRTLQEIVDNGRAQADDPDVDEPPQPEPAEGAVADAAAADGATDGVAAAEGEGALAGLRGQMERRALIRGNMRWAAEVNARQQGDEVTRGFLRRANPDDPRLARFTPEDRVQALDDEPEAAAAAAPDEAAEAAARPTAAEGRAVLARVRGRYLARAAARAEPEPDAAAPPAGAEPPVDSAGQLSRMSANVADEAASAVTEGSPGAAAQFARRAALKNERIQRTLRGEPTDDLPPDDESIPGGYLPTQPEYSERDDDFAKGVEDAQSGKFTDPMETYGETEPGTAGGDYLEGHAAQTRLNTLDDFQKVADYGLRDEGMTTPADAATDGAPDPVGPDVVDAAPRAVAAAPAAAAGEGEDVGGAIGRGFAAAGEAIAEGGGPEDFLGDIAAIGIGLGTVFAGLGAQKKPEEPKPLPSIAPTTAKGVI
jgi:hypothetical protein